ncbi:MAG: hypothetical protein HYY23_14495 [Verrucomicrobia bacterium]|nr:hypothetical protein [Verrucomicrobiota bacterium]
MKPVDIARSERGFSPDAGRRFLALFVLLLAFAQVTLPAKAAFVRVGEIAADLTLKKRKTGEAVSLRDFAGKVIFLDLFAYW